MGAGTQIGFPSVVLHKHSEGGRLDLDALFNQLVLVGQLRQVVARRKVDRAATWQLHTVGLCLAALLKPVVLRAVVAFLALLCPAGVVPVAIRVELELFPSVAVAAVEAVLAGVTVIDNLGLGVPCGALLGIVGEEVGFAAEVLPVVGVDAELALVVFLLVRAPDRLEVEAVEVVIAVHSLDQVNRNFGVAVGEGAVRSVFADA